MQAHPLCEGYELNSPVMCVGTGIIQRTSFMLSTTLKAEERPRFRAQVLAHKKRRTLPIGPHATLYFEDRLTIQYQIQGDVKDRADLRARGHPR